MGLRVGIGGGIGLGSCGGPGAQLKVISKKSNSLGFSQPGITS